MTTKTFTIAVESASVITLTVSQYGVTVDVATPHTETVEPNANKPFHQQTGNLCSEIIFPGVQTTTGLSSERFLAFIEDELPVPVIKPQDTVIDSTALNKLLNANSSCSAYLVNGVTWTFITVGQINGLEVGSKVCLMYNATEIDGQRGVVWTRLESGWKDTTQSETSIRVTSGYSQEDSDATMHPGWQSDSVKGQPNTSAELAKASPMQSSDKTIITSKDLVAELKVDGVQAYFDYNHQWLPIAEEKIYELGMGAKVKVVYSSTQPDKVSEVTWTRLADKWVMTSDLGVNAQSSSAVYETVSDSLSSLLEANSVSEVHVLVGYIYKLISTAAVANLSVGTIIKIVPNSSGVNRKQAFKCKRESFGWVIAAED